MFLEFLREAMIHDLCLEEVHLIIQMSLFLKDVTKVMFIPKLKSLLEVLKLLLELIHFLAMRDCNVLPLGRGHGLELWMGEPKSLKF